MAQSNLGSLHKGDSSIWVTHFPGLKKPVLAIGNKNVLRKVASFNNEDVAEEFYIMLCDWLGAKEADE